MVNMLGQQIMLAFVDMISSDKQVKKDSNNLVNLVLPKVAKAMYRGMVVIYVDVNKYP